MIEKYLKHYFQNRPMFLGLIRAKELELFARFLPEKKNLLVLDFGAGDGFYLDTFLQFHPRDWQITAVDISASELAKAQSYGIYEKFTDYNGKELPYPDASFDLVISNCVLEHVDDLQLNVQEIARVLRPGGKFITTVMSARWEKYLFGGILLGSLYMRFMRAKQVHKNLLSAKQWRDLFAKVGFKVQKEIGYLDRRAGMSLDLMHYVSVPALISYKLFRKWVVMPAVFDLLPLQRFFRKLIAPDLPSGQGAAIFFSLSIPDAKSDPKARR